MTIINQSSRNGSTNGPPIISLLPHGDNDIRLSDLSIYVDFLNAGKPTPLFLTFSEGVKFFWGVELDGLEYKPIERDLGNKKFRPLLDAPKEGQTKFEQILEWAKKQQK